MSEKEAFLDTGKRWRIDNPVRSASIRVHPRPKVHSPRCFMNYPGYLTKIETHGVGSEHRGPARQGSVLRHGDDETASTLTQSIVAVGYDSVELESTLQHNLTFPPPQLAQTLQVASWVHSKH